MNCLQPASRSRDEPSATRNHAFHSHSGACGHKRSGATLVAHSEHGGSLPARCPYCYPSGRQFDGSISYQCRIPTIRISFRPIRAAVSDPAFGVQAMSTSGGSIANRLKSNGLFGALSSSEIDALSWCKSVQNSRFRSRRCWKHWLKPSAPHKSQPSLGYSAFS